jgi:hypothetical protein
MRIDAASKQEERDVTDRMFKKTPSHAILQQDDAIDNVDNAEAKEAAVALSMALAVPRLDHKRL